MTAVTTVNALTDARVCDSRLSLSGPSVVNQVINVAVTQTMP